MAVQRTSLYRFAGLLALLLTLVAGTASAQSPIEGRLQAVTATPPQRSLGEVIEDICPDPTITLVQDLQNRCNEIVGASVLSQRDVAGALDGLQAMAPEEDSVVGATQSDLSAGETDLAARRIELARSGALSRSTLSVNGLHVALAGDAPLGMAAGAGGTGPWNVFVDVAYARSDQDSTLRQSGFAADTWAVFGGIERDLPRNGFAGLGLGYTNTDADIDANGGNVESGEIQLQGYGSVYLTDRLHLDATAGYSRADIDQVRAVRYSIATGAGVTTVDQRALSDTDSDTVWASVTLGYDIYRGDWALMPFATLEVSRSDIDGFTERMSNPNPAAPGSGLAVQIDDQAITSIPLALGLQASRTYRTGWGELTPQAAGELVFEFDNEQDAITGRFVGDTSGTTFALPTDDPDRVYGRVTLGASLTLGEATTGTLAYQGLLGFRDLDMHAFQLSLRHRW